MRTLIDDIEGGHSLTEFLADFPDVSRERTVAVLELATQVLLGAEPSAA